MLKESGWRGSNPRSTAPKAGMLPTTPHPKLLNKLFKHDVEPSYAIRYDFFEANDKSHLV